MSRHHRLAAGFVSVFAGLCLFAGTVWAQCPSGTVTLVADRDNTLYEDASGTLSNGGGDYFFAGRTGQGSDSIRRGLIFFDVAGGVTAGSTISQAILQLTVSQPRNNGMHSISLHTVAADWGEAASMAGMGEGGGAGAQTGDATWVNTFFSTLSWTTPGGDFDPVASATKVVDSGSNGVNSWSSGLVADVQSWLDTPATNFGWLVRGNEASGDTAIRFGTKENTGSEPTLCVRTCGIAITCDIFGDGFESGDVSAWSASVP